MYPVEGSNEVLEKGAMVNPRSGKVENYEEVWEDLELGAKGTSWVLKTERDGVRGMIARIGGFVSGVLRRGGQVSVGRWKDGEIVVKIGELDLPSMEESVKVGDKLEGVGLVWECVERFDWG
jgi:cytochrome c heme-lyase